MVAAISILSALLGAFLVHQFEHERWLRARRADAWSDLVERLALIRDAGQTIQRRSGETDADIERMGRSLQHLDDMVSDLPAALARVRLLGPTAISVLVGDAPLGVMIKPTSEAAAEWQRWADSFNDLARYHLKAGGWWAWARARAQSVKRIFSWRRPQPDAPDNQRTEDVPSSR